MEACIVDTKQMLMERKVTDMMLDMGVPVHLNGFRYLRKSILMCMDDMELVSRGELSPVFFGSALTNFGVETFLQHFLQGPLLFEKLNLHPWL